MPNSNSEFVNTHKIGLSRDDNPMFFEIINKHNIIMDKWNDINGQLHDLRQPKIFLFCQKARLRSFYKPMEELQKGFLEWNKLATEFLEKPSFVFLLIKKRN